MGFPPLSHFSFKNEKWEKWKEVERKILQFVFSPISLKGKTKNKNAKMLNFTKKKSEHKVRKLLICVLRESSKNYSAENFFLQHSISPHCLSLCVCVCVCVAWGPCCYILLLFNGTAVRASSRLQTRHRLPGNCPPIGQHSTSSDQSQEPHYEEVNGGEKHNTTGEREGERGREQQWTAVNCEKVCKTCVERRRRRRRDFSSGLQQGATIRFREQNESKDPF